MARANFVQAARKDYPEHGIKKGESYYWWKFRFGGKRMSKNPPRRSQLTQSEFLGTMYDVEDSISDAVQDFQTAEVKDFDAFAGACEEAAQTVRNAGEECESKRSNMPDQLQDSETGQMLENRYSQCEQLADVLEQAANDIMDLQPEEGTQPSEEAVEEAIGHAEGISWDYE